VLRGDRAGLDLDVSPDVLVEVGADEHLTRGRAGAISRRAVHGIAYHRELHAVLRADESMQHFPAVNSDSHVAGGLAFRRARLVESAYRRLHVHGCPHRLRVVFRIGLRAAEDGEDGGSDEIVDGPIVAKNRENACGVSDRQHS